MIQKKEPSDKIKFENEQLVTKTTDVSVWKKNSFFANPSQSYPIPLLPALGFLKSIIRMQAPSLTGSVAPKIPKLIKLNEFTFCVIMNNILSVFCYLTHEQRLDKKSNKSFLMHTINEIQLPVGVQYIIGNDESIVYMANSEEVIGIQIILDNTEIKVKQIMRVKFQGIRCLACYKTTFHDKLIVLTNVNLNIYNVDEGYEKFETFPLKLVTEKNGLKKFDDVVGIQLIIEDPENFYFLSSAEEKRKNIKLKLGRSGEVDEQPEQKKCEALYITKIQLKNGEAHAKIYIIDFIFQLGIFKRSRAHQVGHETFLVSLFEEIIIIKRNFQKFIVWDNISVLASKSNEKKGELLLGGNRIMLYSQLGELHVHQIFFQNEEMKLKFPMIDTIKGNDNDEEIMYDALIFEIDPGTYTTILFYFKGNEIDLPNRPKPVLQDEGSDVKKNNISLSLLIIEQMKPTDRLKDLLRKNKKPEEIDLFMRRFQTPQIVYHKSIWEVSEKSIKQIEGILLEIKDNQYIQTQLTNILKSKPHDLQFLLTIETKQIQRYQLLLANKLLKLRETLDRSPFTKNSKNSTKIIQAKYSQQQITEIKQIMAWYLESKMFEKKLKYSQNFLSFKQYDFIEIGKLKAASLREEIKLLGCKGYEKRLKYFLNNFKYLILDDFRTILRFFLSDMNQFELMQSFSKNYPFILPSYTRKQSQQPCRLWDDTFEEDFATIETPKIFKKQMKMEMAKLIKEKDINHERVSEDQANSKLNEIFQEFIQEDWYKKNRYKQHSLLNHTVKELKKSFEQLKNQGGVLRIITQLMFEKAEKNIFKYENVRQVIESLTKQGLFDNTFTLNLYVRIDVYGFISEKKIKSYEYVHPKKPEFINYSEPQYFKFLFNHFKKYLLDDIQPLYNKYRPRLFLERFKLFLNSESALLTDMIDFLHYFNNSSNEQIRLELVTAISKLLKISNSQTSKQLVGLLLEKQIVYKGQFSFDNPIEEAKIALAHFFAPFLNHFKIQSSYYDIVMESKAESIQNLKIINKIIKKYAQEFDSQHSIVLELQKNDIVEEIPPVDLSEVLDFLATILYFRAILNFTIKEVPFIEKIIKQFLVSHKYEQVTTFFMYLLDFGKHDEEKQLSDQYPHYGYLTGLKQDYDLKKEIQEIILKFVHSRYDNILEVYEKMKQPKNQESLQRQLSISELSSGNEEGQEQPSKQIANNLIQASQALQILYKHYSNDIINRQIKYLSMLEHIKYFSIDAGIKVIKNTKKNPTWLKRQTNFEFLLNILHESEISNLAVDDYDEIKKQIEEFNQIHLDFGIAQKGSGVNQQLNFAEYCRFCEEKVIYFTNKKLYRPAIYSIFDLMKTNYYYRGCFHYLLIQILPAQVPSNKIQQLVYTFLTAKNPQNLMNMIDSFFMEYKIAGFCSEETTKGNVQKIFEALLINNQLDQAFFLLIRQNLDCHRQALPILEKFPKFLPESIYTHSLLVHFLRLLKQKNKIKHYPTFDMYKSKFNSLSKEFERMDIIKDIFIFLSHLQISMIKMKDQGEKQILADNYEALKGSYLQYMEFYEIDPDLLVLFEKEDNIHTKIEKFTHEDAPTIVINSAENRNKTKNSYMQKYSEEYAIEGRKLLENEHRLREIKERNKALLEQQVIPAISEAKKALQQKQKLAPTSLLQRKQEKKKNVDLQQLDNAIKQDHEKLKQMFDSQAEQIDDMKTNFHSQTAMIAMKKLQEFRNQRMKLKEQFGISTKTQENQSVAESASMKRSSGYLNPYLMRNRFSKDSMVGDMKASKLGLMGMRGSMMLKPQELKQTQNMRQSYYRPTNKVFNDKNSQFYVPKRQIKVPESIRSQTRADDSLKPKHYEKMKMSVIQQRNREKKLAQTKKVKIPYQQLKKKYIALESNLTPLLQKLQFTLSNTKAAMELIKKIYDTVESLENFKSLCFDLLDNIETAPDFIQQKSLKILEQAFKIKAKISLRSIFPSELFTTIKPLSMKDYYLVAYNIIKPQICKFMQNSKDVSVNSIAVVVRYAFGSDNTFYFKVYEEHTKTLVNSYENNPNLTDKEANQIIEKIQQNYSSLNSDNNRNMKFQRAFLSMNSMQKRKELAKKMIEAMDKRSSLSNKETYAELKAIMEKIK